jgi:hypothetical protein
MRGSYTNCFLMSAGVKTLSANAQYFDGVGVKLTIVAPSVAVDTQVGVLLGDLTRANVRQSLYRRETAVFREGKGDRVERRSERPHGVLLDGRNLKGKRSVAGPGKAGVQVIYLVCGLTDRNSTADISGASTVYDAVIHDDVADGADGIVECSLGLVDDL